MITGWCFQVPDFHAQSDRSHQDERGSPPAALPW